MNNIQEPTVELDPNGPESEIRTDLWNTLPLHLLQVQRELLISRLYKLQTMLGANASPTTIGFYRAMEGALTDLSELIDHRASTKSKKR